MTQYKVGQTVEITHDGWEDEGEPWGKGSRLTLTRRRKGGNWWYGKARNGEEGMFQEKYIAPLSEGPVRTETVTTRRIVPGVYGRVRVNDEGKVGRVGLWLEGHYLNAEELDSLAMVASQLAEALRDVD